MEPKLDEMEKSRRFLGLLGKVSAFVYFLILTACIVYLYAFTEDRFVSTAEFRISEDKSSAADAGLLALALPGLVDSRSLDSQIAISYIHSADLLLDIEKRFGMKEHYNSPKTDFFFRMASDANLEERLEYYRSHIRSHFDEVSGLTVISIESFDPEYSKKVAGYLLLKSEEFVNRVNQQIADRKFDFLHKELDRSSKYLEEANIEMAELQNRYNFISPEQIISSIVTAVNSINFELLQTRGEIATLIRDSPDSPLIEALQSKARSLEDLIATENAKLSGTEKDRLNKISQEFAFVATKIEFRAKLLAGSELLLEKNRSDAITNSKFFTVIQTPFLPEDTIYPKRLYTSITLFVIAILIFIIIRILCQSILERG